MTASDASAALEQRLREALHSARPTVGASAALRASILDIPVSARPVGPIARLGRSLLVLGAAAAVGGIAILLTAAGMPRVPVEGLPPAVGGPVTGFDPSVMGPGLITSAPWVAGFVGLALVLFGGATALGTFFSIRSGTNRGRAMVVAGVLAVLAGIWLIRFDLGLRVGSLRGAPQGYVEAPAGPLDNALVWVSTTAPGQTAVGIFSLRNTAAVPVRIEGLVRTSTDDLAAGGLVALWMPPAGAGYDAPGLDQVRPFEPVTVGPGEEINIYLAIRAGPCAFGPTFDPKKEYSSDELAGYSQVGPEVTIAYSVFGVASTTHIDIDETFAEPARANCVP